MIDEKKLEDMVIEAICEADSSELVDMYNDYADEACWEKIFPMCDFDEIVGAVTPSYIVDHCDDDFRLRDDYFYMDGLGYWCSGSGDDCVWELTTEDELASWIINNEYYYKYDCFDEVQDYIYECENEDEDESEDEDDD